MTVSGLAATTRTDTVDNPGTRRIQQPMPGRAGKVRFNHRDSKGAAQFLRFFRVAGQSRDLTAMGDSPCDHFAADIATPQYHQVPVCLLSRHIDEIKLSRALGKCFVVFMSSDQVQVVRQYFTGLQGRLLSALREMDADARFRKDGWERPEGGGGVAMVLDKGKLWEKAGVNFSDVQGATLPPSATRLRPELEGRPWRAMGVSLVFHPLNPKIPTTHMNVRYFTTLEADSIWWFGGGFDLTPYYPAMEDAISWHRAARDACTPFGEELYPRFKTACDQYFYLPHRGETRGVGGIFFDDFNEPGFNQSFAFTRSVGDAFWPAYAEIVERRRYESYGERERSFQLYRRGRYVEFNLLQDRGTHFGIQSNGRTESILMSLPPLVRWEYDWRPEPNTAEADLYENYLRARDWLKE